MTDLDNWNAAATAARDEAMKYEVRIQTLSNEMVAMVAEYEERIVGLERERDEALQLANEATAALDVRTMERDELAFRNSRLVKL